MSVLKSSSDNIGTDLRLVNGSVADEISGSERKKRLIAIATSTNIGLLRQAAESSNPSERVIAAINPHTPNRKIQDLREDDVDVVRMAASPYIGTMNDNQIVRLKLLRIMEFIENGPKPVPKSVSVMETELGSLLDHMLNRTAHWESRGFVLLR